MSESFYGGKRGISFTIVEHFDSVSDMLDKFSQGGAYETVNYGQYVIIDTIVNLNHKDSLENGLVYSRGYDYTQSRAVVPNKNDYKDKNGNTDTNAYELAMRQYFKAPGAGAVYIGQIVGPQGSTPALEILPESKVKSDDTYESSGSMDVVAGDTQDTVTFAYGNIKDTDGNVISCAIGFTVPYHVFKIGGESVSAYSGSFNESTKQWSYSNLITKTSGNDDSHPYYSIWNLKVPKGIRGQDLVSIGVDENTKQYYYILKDYTKSETGEESERVYLKDIYHRVISQTSFNTANSSFIIDYSDGSQEEPIPARFLDNVAINNKQELTVTYTDSNGTPTVISKPIKFIDNIYYADNGTVTITYNTGETYTPSNKFKTISSIALRNDNKLIINYNTGDEPFVADYAFKFIDNISMDDNQNITITYIVGTNEAGEAIKSTETIENPINFVSEMAVDPSTYNLLCYYSAPAYRAAIPEDKKASYNNKDDWYNLGCVRGESGGIHIVGDFDSLEDLKNTYPTGIPYNKEGALNYKGWVCTVTNNGVNILYTYDYIGEKGWYSIGSLDANLIRPEAVILIDEAKDGAPASGRILNQNGIWLIVADD
jgi:hypothetical protein